MNPHLKHLWSGGQRAAYIQLLEMADLFFYGDWCELSIRPRLTPLVIGQSGTGKSHLVRAVAAELGIPYMRIQPSSWIIAGARQTPTLQRIQEFVASNDQVILHADEIDKASGQTEWSGFLRGEIFDLLDRTPSPLKEGEWGADVISKLQNDAFCVGSGAFQDLWSQAAKAKVGFGENQSAKTFIENIRRLVATTDVIPPELLRRFNQNLIILPPPTEEDFQQAAEINRLSQLAVALNVHLDFKEAAVSGLGARWLEETQARLLLQARRENRTDLAPLRPYPESSMDHEENSEDDQSAGSDDPRFGLTNSVL